MLRDFINTYRQAFRIYVRRWTRPKTMEEAENKSLFWSKAYMWTAFLGFSFCTFITYKKGINFNYRTDIPKEKAVLEKLYTYPTKVHVYRDFKMVDEFDHVPVKEGDSTNDNDSKLETESLKSES